MANPIPKAGFFKGAANITNGELQALFDRPQLPTFADGTRPTLPSALWPAGSSIYNTDDNAPNFSDGAGNWRDAAGVIT